MPTIQNDTEEDVDYAMDDGRPDDEEGVLFRARIPAGKSVFFDKNLPPNINHRFFSTKPQAPPQPRRLADLRQVTKDQNVRLTYAVVPAAVDDAC